MNLNFYPRQEETKKQGYLSTMTTDIGKIIINNLLDKPRDAYKLTDVELRVEVN